jgi:hypothetical protein
MLTTEASDSLRKSLGTLLVKLTWACMVGSLGWAIYSSCRLAIADQYYSVDTPTSVAAAIRLEPGNADYHALLAEHEEGNGVNPSRELLEAVALSPLTSSYLVRAALRSEVDRDFPAAEKFLIKAAQVDRKFAPRWALLSFYFRRGSETRDWPAGFWPTLYRALAMSSPADSDAVFQLAWDRSEDPDEILGRIPPESNIRRQYLNFLLGTQRLMPAATVARNLAARATEEDTAILLRYCERASATDTASAVSVWNSLVGRHLISGGILNPSAGRILTNKAFAISSNPVGFDWRMPSVEGVLVSQSDDGNGIKVNFTGDEPEDCAIIKELVPVVPGRRFEIAYKYSSAGAVVRGLRWEVAGKDGIVATSPELSSENDSAQGSVAFVADASTAQLILRYQRPLGTARAEATVTIRELADRILK